MLKIAKIEQIYRKSGLLCVWVRYIVAKSNGGAVS